MKLDSLASSAKNTIKNGFNSLKHDLTLKNFKNMLTKPVFWLFVIFLVILAVRLVIAFQTPLFNYDAYGNLRQIEAIRETGLPAYKDTLSFGGKTNLFAPLNHYIIAFFSLLMPFSVAAKVIPNIIATLIIFVVYYLSLKITKNNKISMFTAIMSGLVPIYFVDLNRISISYLAILLIFSIIYCMLKLNERKYVDYALILMFLLVLATPLAFVLVVGLFIYLLLLKLENHAIEMKELEIILFFTFLVFWVNLLIYKNAFLSHGLLVIWQNIPLEILNEFFVSIGFVESLVAIGIIPIIFGVYAFYASLNYSKDNKEVLLIISLGFSTFILLWFKLIDLINGLMFLGITLTVLTAYSLKRFNDFLDKSKIHKYDKILQVFLIVLFLLTSVPSIISIVASENLGPYDTPTFDEVKVLQWASENTPRSATIMSGLDEGNIVAYYANRKNVMDTNFLLTPRIDQRLKDINDIYTTKFETQAIGIMNSYKSKYLVVSPKTLEEYDTPMPAYLNNNECFQLEYYSSDTYLYRMDCKIE
ncbi:MAG TPA: glycosyltransferase family 39 protein [Alphaproteobacteria bacterium]|nr:glycosyltransferase family 39 protein [Alphaproteobacteria bacterium]